MEKYVRLSYVVIGLLVWVMLAAFLSTLPAATTDRLQASVQDAYLCGRPDGARSFPTTAVAVKAIVPRA